MKSLTIWIAGLMLSGLCWAQLASTTSIVGTVTDTAGAVIGDAGVTAINQDTQETLAARTNAEGYYAFQFIKIGAYALSVSHAGFETIRKTGVLVDAGRNIFRGPGFIDWDFSLFKNFPIRESARFQLRGEFFNIFSQPSFSNPGAVLGSATFGVISGTSNNHRGETLCPIDVHF